ncbi:pentapeptide repeat-containing protein [Kitasatospora xanthocidica]|uniref:pentapeptide repeat-containing protein n=1 Tax=Kitasatospora xanthocidica TaxID=83382 RepID=UPI0036EDB33D
MRSRSDLPRSHLHRSNLHRSNLHRSNLPRSNRIRLLGPGCRSDLSVIWRYRH